MQASRDKRLQACQTKHAAIVPHGTDRQIIVGDSERRPLACLQELWGIRHNVCHNIGNGIYWPGLEMRRQKGIRGDRIYTYTMQIIDVMWIHMQMNG